jgi:hypothetical protein
VPRKRMIHECIWRSETLAKLPRDARYLFIGLVTTADDQGRRRGNPGLIRSDIFPLDDVALTDISKWLEALEIAESITCYQADGVDLIQVTNWWEYQQPTFAWPSEYLPPGGWTDRCRYRRGNEVITRNWPGVVDTKANPTSGQSEPTVSPRRAQSEPNVNPAPNGSGSGNDSGSDGKTLAPDGAKREEDKDVPTPDEMRLRIVQAMATHEERQNGPKV